MERVTVGVCIPYRVYVFLSDSLEVLLGSSFTANVFVSVTFFF